MWFIKKYYFNELEVCLLGSILITIWPIAPSGNFFNNWLSIVYYLPVGIFLWSIKNKKTLFKYNIIIKNFFVVYCI